MSFFWLVLLHPHNICVLLKVLLINGASFNARSLPFSTALSLAAAGGHETVVGILYLAGEDNQVNNQVSL